MRVPARIALAALALAAAPGRAGAQWRATPMLVPAPAGADVLPGRFTAASGADELLVVDRATGAAVRRGHGALLVPQPTPYVLPASTPVRAGRTRANGADLLSELAYPEGNRTMIVYGTAPDLPVPRSGPAGLMSFAHVMPHEGDTPVFPGPDVGSGTGWIDVRDDEASSPLGGTQLARTWRADGLGPLASGEHEVFPVRLSPAAVALGVDDLALPTGGGVFLLAHRPPTPDLRYVAPPVDLYSGLELAGILVGGPSALERPPWLPASIAAKGDALGAAALDLDGDGLRDLVFSYGSALDVPDGGGGFLANHLVVVRGTGDPAELAAPAGAWEDVTAHPALALRDPVVLRPVQVGGEPAAAVWDRDADAIVVFWREAGGALRAWRGSCAGRNVRDLRVADVVGSAAPDLVAIAEDVLVYPDVGEASPALAWAAGSPGQPTRGEDHVLSVSASDADGDLALEWFVGDPYGAPVSSSVVAAGAGQVVDHAVAGTLLCEPPPQTLAVTVRATDALGVFDELSASLPVVLSPPSLALAGALPDGRLALPRTGTTATFEGSARSGCAAGVVFTWGGTIFDAAPSPTIEDTPTTTRRIFSLGPESYPALLAVAEPDVTLGASDGGATSGPVRLPLALDAAGLVDVVSHAADVPALAEGEVAVLRTVIRSGIGVGLPGVRVVDLLGGLAPAGAPRVQGAIVSATARDGAEIVLESLPGGGAEVVIELPVRSVGRRGASAVEVRSAGGHLLSPAASRSAPEPAVPGCGCGGSAPGLEALVGVLAALSMLRRIRRRRMP